MARPETIASAANPLVKDVRRAVARGSLTADGWCVAETFHLLEEALRSQCEVKIVLAAESVRADAMGHVRGLASVRLAVLPDNLFQSISGTEAAQGVMALVRPPEWKIEQLFRNCPLVVVLDGLQDPGNAGAILRAAEAFGSTGALFVKGTVSPHNPKTIRASAGSVFRVPCLSGIDAAVARTALQQNQVQLYASVPARPAAPARALAEVNFVRPCGLVIGNEARGVGTVLRAAAQAISIPTVGVESLNAAVAAGILLYEARRQRTVRA
ncbi:MAG: TrmH family RNA methyltransferase [Bryobacteraceae bacterium]